MFRSILLTAAAGIVLVGASSAQAQSYDMDCKVILCMAGGFPPGCADAYAYMIDRVTDFPNPKPPFGTCSMSNGSPYSAVDAPYSYLRTDTAEGWDCPDTHQLFFENTRNSDSQISTEVFCYSHSTIEIDRESGNSTRVYHDQLEAEPLNFEVQITVATDTVTPYSSPLYRLNWSTGHVATAEVN